jgi:hypothetical protein
MQTLVTFRDGTSLVYEKGRFDEFKVSFYSSQSRHIESPTDIRLFTFFLSLHNNDGVWRIIQNIAAQIDSAHSFSDLNIPTLNDTLEEQKLFSAVGAAMLSERYKAHTRLGKRVKLLGCHQVLVQGLEPRIAANWSRGRRWREIDAECRRLGF